MQPTFPKKKIGWLIVSVLSVINIGGLVEITPFAASFLGMTEAQIQGLPADALRIEGRDVYLREGCGTCHTQMIRPFVAETERYGSPSVLGDSAYDHPALFGSKRTGPDLARIGGRYSEYWHQQHLRDPRSVSLGSVMPAYPWLQNTIMDGMQIASKMRAMNTLFSYTCPKCKTYSEKEIQESQGKVRGKTEEDALIAYLYGDVDQPGGLGHRFSQKR